MNKKYTVIDFSTLTPEILSELLEQAYRDGYNDALDSRRR